VSTAALRGDGYLPEPVTTRAPTAASLGAALAACGSGKRPAPLLAVACPLAVTRSATLGRHVAHATGAALENLEAFAVARAVLGQPGIDHNVAGVTGDDVGTHRGTY